MQIDRRGIRSAAKQETHERHKIAQDCSHLRIIRVISQIYRNARLSTISKPNSAFHPSGVRKWVPASAGMAKAGMVHSITGWMQGVQVKLRSLENACHTWAP